jgi:dsRNA-specific ribonuclease
MKSLQLLRWSGSVLSPRTRSCSRLQHACTRLRRHSSTSPALLQAEDDQLTEESAPIPSGSLRNSRLQYPSPPVEAARKSARIAALHARLYLPKRLPIETLARTLVDASADPHPDFNNESLATLGHDLLTYYSSEHLLCTFPRLPLTVIFAAIFAYVGPKTLAAMTREWGVEFVAVPGGEVDPGLLQFKRLPPGTNPNATQLNNKTRSNNQLKIWRKSITSSVVYDDEFGDPAEKAVHPAKLSSSKVPDPQSSNGVTQEQASATFVRALMGAIYLHAGRPAAKQFFKEHFLSRHLNISELFNFSQPTRDLSRLCAREGFERPVARIISETGRLSRHPVFVVGIFSGDDKLGEGTGGSLEEARFRAAVAALKGWYLYSPLNVRVPSSMEEEAAEPWKPVYVDLGEVIV